MTDRSKLQKYYKNYYKRENHCDFQDQRNRRKYKDHYKDKYRDDSDRSYNTDDSYSRDRAYDRNKSYN